MSSSNPDRPLVVLVVGREATLRDAAVAELRESALAGAPADFNEDRFDLEAPGTDPARIAAAARTLPLMSERRVVWVRGLGARRAAKFVDGELAGYLEDPSPSTCLVLEAEKVDKRQKWVKRIAKLGRVIDCAGPTRPAELRKWIDARIARIGRQPARGVAAALLEAVGPELDLLTVEIDKLALYAGERTELTPEDVAEVTGHLRPRALYELTDSIGNRQLASALRIANELIDAGEAPLAVLGTLANHFRRLMRARECRPLSPESIARTLAVHPFAARKLAEQARRFDLRRLRRCLGAVRRTDEALKGSLPLTPRLAIERLVLAVCS